MIEARVLELSSLLHEELTASGFPPAVPASGHAQSHILTLGKLDGGGHGFSTDLRIASISARLQVRKIIHTIRRGQLRFAVHAYNNEDDVKRTAEVVREAICVA
jgi:selenocysteine lyase/cysteine desulfurase